MRHCRLKNLVEATMEYYQEDLEYFQRITQLKYVNEITREVMDNFVDHEINKGNRVSAINTRIRELRGFFNYCAEYTLSRLMPGIAILRDLPSEVVLF